PILAKCQKAALKMEKLISESEKLAVYKSPDLDILNYFPSDLKKTSQISAKSKEIFETGMRNRSFYLSLFKVPAKEFIRLHPEFEVDSETVTILRSVFMKPEHEDFVEELVGRIEREIQN